SDSFRAWPRVARSAPRGGQFPRGGRRFRRFVRPWRDTTAGRDRMGTALTPMPTWSRCGPRSQFPPQGNSRMEWHLSTDVVVIGAGAAGLAAAVSARDHGAAVVVVEE